MSIIFGFRDNKFNLKKLNLPSRYYLFDDSENYIKLLNIGEGIFPKDRVKTALCLDNSNLVLTTESATKIYPSKNQYFSTNFINIDLKNSSNLEFLNDELIIYKDAKFIQTFRLSFDDSSTFFYVDIQSSGRSFENFDFSYMKIKNSFYENSDLEYIEKFDINGDELKDYIKRKDSKTNLFAKIYIKTLDNDYFLDNLYLENFKTFSYSKRKKILIGVLSSNNMANLKDEVLRVWNLYRKNMKKSSFNLGKN